MPIPLLLAGAGIVFLLVLGGIVLLSNLVRDASTQDKLRALKKGAAAGTAAATVFVVLVSGSNPNLTPQQELELQRLTQEAEGPVEVIQVFNDVHFENALDVAQEEGFEVVERIDTTNPEETPAASREIVVLKAAPSEVLETEPVDSSGVVNAMDW